MKLTTHDLVTAGPTVTVSPIAANPIAVNPNADHTPQENPRAKLSIHLVPAANRRSLFTLASALNSIATLKTTWWEQNGVVLMEDNFHMVPESMAVNWLSIMSETTLLALTSVWHTIKSQDVQSPFLSLPSSSLLGHQRSLSVRQCRSLWNQAKTSSSFATQPAKAQWESTGTARVASHFQGMTDKLKIVVFYFSKLLQSARLMQAETTWDSTELPQLMKVAMSALPPIVLETLPKSLKSSWTVRFEVRPIELF